MATKKKSKKSSPAKRPEILFANASPLSIGGVSMFAAGTAINAENIGDYFSEEHIINDAVSSLKRAGFTVLQVAKSTINIAGPVKLFEKAFATRIAAEERDVIKPGAREDTATFWECRKTDIPGLISTKGTAFANSLEGVAIEEPRYSMGPDMFSPRKAYWHLVIPGDVSLGCNADKAHRSAVTGRGIKVSMVDSGWYRHPYFTGRGYRVAPVVLGPGAEHPENDESGHGTGESANIFALAPDIELLPVKMSFVNTLGAFNAAVDLHPDIITCSWGSSIRTGPLSAASQALAAAIASAVASGIVVVFSAGNGHYGFPGQHPDVISAGGVFMDSDGSLRASDYASGFLSEIYPDRRVPDLSGLVGMQPGASYIMLPLEPGDSIDTTKAKGSHPAGDETAPDDGWAAFSGTSAAAPQLAGAAALVKQVCPELTPVEVRDILMKSARDVSVGSCSPSTGAHAATQGPDLATGTGLVDACKATLIAKVRRQKSIRPSKAQRTPDTPESSPVRPADLFGEQETTVQTAPPGHQSALSREDLEALEEMISNSDGINKR